MPYTFHVLVAQRTFTIYMGNGGLFIQGGVAKDTKLSEWLQHNILPCHFYDIWWAYDIHLSL